MEFRILGPFEVVDNGGSLALGGARQRALLAVLLLHRSEVVSTDRLVDELWGDRAPATAAKTIQVYVSQLARSIGDGGLAETVARLSSGDRVVVAVDQLEELLTVCEAESERTDFLEQLADAASDSERRVLITCSLRADFYGRIGSLGRSPHSVCSLSTRSRALVDREAMASLASTASVAVITAPSPCGRSEPERRRRGSC